MERSLPLLLLHGALGDASQMAPLATHLADRTPVEIVEFEGHGATPARDRPFRIQHFAENVLDRMKARSAGPVDLFGYSMGGYVALYLAASAPEQVRRVATLATKLAWTPEVAARECAMLDADTIRAKVPRFADALARRHTAAGMDTVLQKTAEMLRSLGEAPLLSSDALSAIEHPVRLAVGDRDATVGLDETAAAARCLPNGELEVHPRTPHPFEKVPLDRVARSILEFFRA